MSVCKLGTFSVIPFGVVFLQMRAYKPNVRRYHVYNCMKVVRMACFGLFMISVFSFRSWVAHQQRTTCSFMCMLRQASIHRSWTVVMIMICASRVRMRMYIVRDVSFVIPNTIAQWQRILLLPTVLGGISNSRPQIRVSGSSESVLHIVTGVFDSYLGYYDNHVTIIKYIARRGWQGFPPSKDACIYASLCMLYLVDVSVSQEVRVMSQCAPAHEYECKQMTMLLRNRSPLGTFMDMSTDQSGSATSMLAGLPFLKLAGFDIIMHQWCSMVLKHLK